MQLNRHKLIFYRNGMPLLADITGNTPSVPVGDPDLVMLDVLCRVGSSNDMITPIREESVFQQFFAHLQTAQIEQRLGQYQSAGVLVDHVEHPPTFLMFNLSVSMPI